MPAIVFYGALFGTHHEPPHPKLAVILKRLKMPDNFDVPEILVDIFNVANMRWREGTWSGWIDPLICVNFIFTWQTSFFFCLSTSSRPLCWGRGDEALSGITSLSKHLVREAFQESAAMRRAGVMQPYPSLVMTILYSSTKKNKREYCWGH